MPVTWPRAPPCRAASREGLESMMASTPGRSTDLAAVEHRTCSSADSSLPSAKAHLNVRRVTVGGMQSSFELSAPSTVESYSVLAGVDGDEQVFDVSAGRIHADGPDAFPPRRPVMTRCRTLSIRL